MDFRWLYPGRDEWGRVAIAPFERFAGPEHVTPEWIAAHTESHSIRRALVLDTETTGLDPARDRIIEIGLAEIAYQRTDGTVLAVTDRYTAMEDPGAPLSSKVRELTGLTDEMLAGRKIDDARVAAMVARADIVIAHHASFDRPFVDRRFGKPRTIWACSIEQVDWHEHGLPSSKLEVLCALHGFYSVAHRALADAESLVQLLSLVNGETGQTYLRELLEMGRQPWVQIAAVRSPFESKDALKERGYSWDAGRKVWRRVMPATERDVEVQWLEAEVYRGRSMADVRVIAPVDRFAGQ